MSSLLSMIGFILLVGLLAYIKGRVERRQK
jgi:hypothetical protein